MLNRNDRKINVVYTSHHDPITDKITVDYDVTVGTHFYAGSLTECSSVEEANKIANSFQRAYDKVVAQDALGKFMQVV